MHRESKVIPIQAVMSRIILNEAQKVSKSDNYEYKPLGTSS
jgi:hypothetical protein